MDSYLIQVYVDVSLKLLDNLNRCSVVVDSDVRADSEVVLIVRTFLHDDISVLGLFLNLSLACYFFMTESGALFRKLRIAIFSVVGSHAVPDCVVIDTIYG